MSKSLRVITAIPVIPHDSKTFEPLLEQIQSDQRPLPREVNYDRGGQGIKETLSVKVITPNKAKAKDILSPYIAQFHTLCSMIATVKW